MDKNKILVIGRGSGKNSLALALIEMMRTQEKVVPLVKANDDKPITPTIGIIDEYHDWGG